MIRGGIIGVSDVGGKVPQWRERSCCCPRSTGAGGRCGKGVTDLARGVPPTREGEGCGIHGTVRQRGIRGGIE